MGKPEKLHVVKSREKGQEAWTVRAGKRGEQKPSFLIRFADPGHRVMFRFYDQTGKRRERYCCYLSAKEWREAQRKSLADFARLIGGKVEALYASGDLDADRYREISPRLNALL